MANAPSVALIIDATAEYYGVSANDIRSNRRTVRVALPRHAALWLARKLTPQSLPEIGRRFGGRDHTTVLHSVNKMEAARALQPETARELVELETIVLAASSTLAALNIAPAADLDAQEIAMRLIHEPLARLQISVDEIRTLAHGVITMQHQLAEQARQLALQPPLTGAATKALASHDALRQARFSPRERYAQDDFERAMKALKTALTAEGKAS